MTRQFELSRRKVLASVGAIGAAGAGAGMGTSALFSDEEEFENNTIQAGTTNLIVEAKVAALSSGLQNSNGDVILEATDDQGDSDAEVDGAAEIGFKATDIKPGDSFVIGFNVIVEDNPMYVGFEPNDMRDDEGANPEPEPQPGKDKGGGIDPFVSGGGNDGVGDLDNHMILDIGNDGTNDFSWNQGATAPNDLEFTTQFPQPYVSEVFDRWINLPQAATTVYHGNSAPLGHGDPLAGAAPTELGGGDNVTHWWYFELPKTTSVIGSSDINEVMGDSFSFDLTWYGEQVRNNNPPSEVSDLKDGSVN